MPVKNKPPKKRQYDINNYCKEKGLDGVRDVTTHTDVSPQTLRNWFNHKKKLFEVVILGTVIKKEGEEND